MANSLVACAGVSSFVMLVAYYVLSDPLMSLPIPFFAIEYGLFVTAIGVFTYLLSPAKDFWNYNVQGSIFYFMCFMFTAIAALQLTVQVHGLSSKTKAKLIEKDVLYLKFLYGISSEIFHAVFTIIMSWLMISKLDNGSSPRNLALYWCGASLAHEMIAQVALFFKKSLLSLHYSSGAHFLYMFSVFLILRYFLKLNPRQKAKREDSCFYTRRENMVTMVLFAVTILYTGLRLIGSGKAKVKLNYADTYTSRFEPLVRDDFGSAWVIVSAIWVVPCCCLGIYHLIYNSPHKNRDMAVLFAGAMFHGTVAHLIYYVLLALKTKPPRLALAVVIILNLLILFGTHLYVYCSMPDMLHPFRPTPMCMVASDDDEETEEDDDDGEEDDDSEDCYYKKHQ